MAVMLPDGYIQVVDRLKDVIKTGGEWVSSIEVEHLICGIPGVRESAVMRRAGRKMGRTPYGRGVRQR
ncbi:hypothetical protein ACU4GD_21750 [Cupriavidus basilensis]